MIAVKYEDTGEFSSQRCSHIPATNVWPREEKGIWWNPAREISVQTLISIDTVHSLHTHDKVRGAQRQGEPIVQTAWDTPPHSFKIISKIISILKGPNHATGFSVYRVNVLAKSKDVVLFFNEKRKEWLTRRTLTKVRTLVQLAREICWGLEGSEFY